MYISNQGKIMRKLLGKPSTESDSTLGITSSPIPAVYRPNVAQNTSYQAGAPIASFDASPDGRTAILASRHILKTVSFDGLQIREGVDIRAYITSQPPNRAALSTSIADQLSVRDVKWASGYSEASIFTACANGKIFQYDLTRLGSTAPGGTGLEFIQIREDSRQVNTLDINPHRGTYMLSGSQDGIVRCFDIREPIPTRTGRSFRAVQAFKCNAEGVRIVQWSPKDGFVFACATEQGVILKWDIRKSSAPTLRIGGHEKACTSISWHADGEHLISAGSDSKCHVWDMSKNADKRQKPKWSISTPGPVAAVSWRPGQWSATAQGKRAAQVAVSYDETSPKRSGIHSVHIWDLARPTMPYKEIHAFKSSPYSLRWHDQDLLWTAGDDGQFSQCDVAFAPKVIDRTTVSSMALSAQGEVLMFLDERPPTQRLRPPVIHQDTVPSSYSSSPTTPMLSISRSDSEDDVVGTFLGPRRRAGRKRRPSTRSTHTLSSTPPSGMRSDDPIISLDQSLKMTGFYKSQQAMAIGPVPSGVKVKVYQYLSAVYLDTIERGLPRVSSGPNLPERLAEILECFAKAAENVSQFRLAQTWRILAYAMDLLLRRRAQFHQEKRLRQQHGYSPMFNRWDGAEFEQSNPRERGPGSVEEGDETPRKVLSTSNLGSKAVPLRSLLAEEIESTSNVPTPLVRPVEDDLPVELQRDQEVAHRSYIAGKKLTPVLESDSFKLPPAVRDLSASHRQRLDSMPLSDASHGSENTQLSSTDGYDFYDADALAKAIDVPQIKKKEPVALDFMGPRSLNSQRRPVARQDSDESFAQIFALSQMSGQSNSSGGSLSKKAARVESIPEHYEGHSHQMDWEYQSRIRGKRMEDSPHSSQLSLFHNPLERTNTNVTETTDEDYQMVTQTTSGSVPSQGYYSRSAEANSESFSRPHRDPRSGPRSVVSSVGDTAERLLESDFLPSADDPPYPFPVWDGSDSIKIGHSSPLQPYVLISRALAFETRSSALNASAMVLLLKPLVPEDVIDKFQATAILRQHHSRLMSMKLFIEAALLRNLCVKGWPGGALSDWGENYSSIVSQAQHGHGISVGLLCPKCRKPRDIDRTSRSAESIWRCDRCDAIMGPCAVCGHRDEAPNPLPLHSTQLAGITSSKDESQESAILSTWWYCPGCGHGGHSTCLEGWHSTMGTPAADRSPLIGSIPDPTTSDAAVGVEFSDGCCPMDGCGHACLPGRWRTEAVVARSEEVTRVMRENARSGPKTLPLTLVAGDRDRRATVEFGIRGDGYEVGQSRAVESVRESLASDRDSGRVLSSSPGRSGGERERRKSVKFAGTEDRR